MLLASPSWLDEGDKISSIVSAFISILSLVITIYQTRRSPTMADQPFILSRRWRPWAVAVCAVIATASALRVVWAPGRFLVATVVVGAVACFAAIVIVIWGVITRLRSLKRLDPAVRRLLDTQLSEADFHQYKFGSLSLPGVSLIYVEQYLGAVNAKRNSTRFLDVEELVRHIPKAIVVGVPGAGKSTLAAHVVGTAADWWTKARVMSRVSSSPYGRLIPVLLPAKALIGNDVPIALESRWSQTGIDARLFTRNPYKKVRWLIIVDSLDEISSGEARTRVIQRLGSFIASSAKTHLIVTTRALTVGELADLTSRGAQELHLRLFGQSELLSFATNWLRARGGGHVDAANEAARFINHISSSALTSIVRVPLLATMAILVYEGDRDQPLPTSRSALYHEFICLLRGARDVEPSTPFEKWLMNNLEELLKELASAYVHENTRRLLTRAIVWVSKRAPKNLLASPDSERLGVLRNLLIASGLCVFVPSLDTDDEPRPMSLQGGRPLGNDVEFIHLTIAEYLAADPRIYKFSYDKFRLLMADGSTRGFALFTLARGEADPSEIVRSLLKDDDLVSAGRIIADGITVAGELRQKTIDELIDRVTSDHPAVFECVSVLVDISVAPDVFTRLNALASDERQTLWARVVIADALADLNANVGLDLLQSIVRDSRESESDAIWWATRRLASHGATGPSDVAPSYVMPGRLMLGTRSLSEIGRQACIRTATDQRQPAPERADAASRLHAAGDEIGTRVLHGLVIDEHADAKLRLEIARTLSATQDEQGVATLRALAVADGKSMALVPVEVRRAAANDLVSLGDPAGTKALQQLVSDYGLPRNERRQIAVLLAERDDRIGRETLARLDRKQARRTASIQLGGLTLVGGSLAWLSAGALLSGKLVATLALASFVGIATAIAWPWLRAARRPIRATVRRMRPLPVEEYKPRSRSRDLEYLAYAVHVDLAKTRAAQFAYLTSATVQGEFIRTYLAPRNLHGSRLLPHDLKDMLVRAPTNPVVILGPPGSGKTQLATTLVLDLIARREKGNVVPALLSLRAWSASDRSLEDWMVEAMARDYAMPVNVVASLVDESRILPVLDGLDELMPDQQRVAASAVNAMARRGTTFVVTCRTQDYMDLAGKGDPFDHATLLDMQPVQARDLIDFIMTNVPSEYHKAWTPIISELEQESPGPFAELMSSPLTAMLALRPYLIGGDPGQLLRQAYARRSSSVDARLGDVLDDYLSSAISTMARYTPNNSRRWLRTIAEYMKSEGSNEFTWWTLPRLVPTQLMSIMILLAITVPPVIAVIIAQRFQAIHAPTVVATVIMTLGLLAVSTQESTRIPYGKSPEASMRAATINSLAQTAALTFGSTVLAYVGTDHFGSALIVGFAAIGFFWTTYFGRFLLSLVYLSRLNQLPMSLTRFLGETRYAGITTYDGPAYKFVHVILEDLVAAG